jgi:hypothetical protein
MKRSFTRLFLFTFLSLGFCLSGMGQASSTGSISGTATDPKGAVVSGATVVIKNVATNQEFTTQTNNEGYFRVPSLNSGVYTATITAQGFKQANVTDVKVDVGLPSTVNVQLEVGAQTEQVTIVGGGEILKTENANVGTTLIGRQITDIPTASRDALDLVLALPGTTTPGRPRTSSVNGLPKGGLNITLDGINVQDNLLKSSDGFFTYIRPRTDAVSEVTVSTSNPGAESSGEGAVQIKFATQGGSNAYHGGLYWYHRNPALNTNYWFNNRDLRADPVTGKAPQNRILLNQPGGKIGGPISIPKLFSGKDRAFFFINYEEFRLPERTARVKTILSPQAQAGNYRFFVAPTYVPPTGSATTCAPATNPNTGAAAQLCTTNVYTLAGSGGLAFTNGDPTITALLTSIRGSLSSAIVQDTGDPNLQTATFINSGGQTRKFPTTRLDFNITKKHHVETIWNYQQFRSQVDFLNAVDPAFPGFPNFGSQDSNRFSFVNAWRWTLNNNMVNEARFGVTGGTSLFFSQVNSGQFQNQGGFNLGIGAFGISSATVVTGPSRRNSPVKQFTDTLSYIKGNHSTSFGFSFTQINLWSQVLTAVPSAVFTTSATLDAPGFNAFSLLNSAGVQNGAAQLYNVLSGRLNGVNGNARLSETTNNYTYLGDLTSRAQQREWGLFAQDTWRVRPNLTVNYGLRYEVQLPFQAKNNTYAGTTYADLFGESGEGNLFRPGGLVSSPTTISGGVCAGCKSTYTLFGAGSKAYETSYNNFAPSVGFAYQPNFGEGWLRKVFGTSGQTVLRGGFSMAYIREGTNTFQNILGSNPGGTLTANRSLTLGNLPVGTYLRQGPFAPPAFPTQPTYPNTGLNTDSVNAFDPNIKIGYVESWTASFQREISPNMAVEIRYVGNRGHKLWRQYNLNEINVLENGFLEEFKLAQQNLLANLAANGGAGRCQAGVTAANCQLNFAYFGPGTGTSPLPIIARYFGGNVDPTSTASYASANFRGAVFFNTLNPLAPNPTGFGATLAGVAFDSRRLPTVTAGVVTAPALFPFNHFRVNQGKIGGAFLLDNGGQSWYDGLTIELRRRLSRGLLVQSSFTFSKALGNTYASASNVFDQPSTLRDPQLKRGVVPFDINTAFKTNFIYELPFGKGRAFLGGSNGLVDKLVGGWGVNGNIRIQSGTPFQIGNVQLVGLTQQELQKAVGVYREADGFVYALPADIRQNTFRAFNIALTATGAGYTQGAPTGRYIAPAASGNCLQAFSGGCGFANLVLKGPAFFRSDLSVVKRIRFTENTNFEMRGEFLNAFNNINFLVGNAANDVNTLGGLNTAAFGRITSAYQDLSTTNDPGGRLVQLVLRLNF